MTRVYLSGGRGWLVADPAASVARIDTALGRLLDINEAGRTWDQQNKFYQAYLAYLNGKPWAPYALSPDAPSIHQLGGAVDTDDHVHHTALLNEHGWFQTVFWPDGSLREEWHFEYFKGRDKHINDAPPVQESEDEDDMLALRIKTGSGTHLATLGVGVFRHFIHTDPYDKIMRLMRAKDDWQDVDLTELPALLRTYGCDLHIWDVRNGQFVVVDPLDGSIKPGNMWSALNVARSGVEQIKVTSEQTAKYLSENA